MRASEALYVLDGLLNNNTVLQPTEHYTDTHGYTEDIFALCYLLGFVHAQAARPQRSAIVQAAQRSELRSYRFNTETCPDLDLIPEQWDELVRLSASLKNHVAAPSTLLRRLISSPNDRLARALTALGRVVKTIYLLRYFHDGELRQRVQRQLNRGRAPPKPQQTSLLCQPGRIPNG